MKERPLVFKVLALTFLFIAFSFPVQIMVLFEHRIYEVGAIVAKIAPWNWFVIFACLLNIPLLLRASSALRFSIPTLALIVMHNNALVAYYGLNFSLMSTIFSSMLFCLLCSTLLQKDALQLIRNKKMRWWIPAKRFSVDMPVSMQLEQSDLALNANSMDVSKSGMLVKMAKGSANMRLKLGYQVNMQFQLKNNHKINCMAKIIRNCELGGDETVGLQFLDLSLLDRMRINQSMA